MSLIHDHRIAAPGDLLPPFLCLLSPLQAGFVGRGTSDGQQATHNERELLQRRDHDLRSVHKGLCQLLGVLINGLNNTLCVLDLVDGILKLAVKHTPIRDDHNTVEHLVVGVGVQARQPMRQP